MASERPRRVAILTSGGDAPGMNAVVRAAVRAGLEKGLEVFAVEEGFQGLVDGGERIRRMGWNDVGGILAKGGTVIGTARCPAFRTREGRLAAARNVARERIDALVVVGGDGSLTGADLFRREWPRLLAELAGKGEIPAETAKAAAPLALVGLVGSIDNDMAGTDMTIGADTALHRIVEAVDALVSTAASHQRTFVVEVMGRNCGYLALMSALATGAGWVLIPEAPPEGDDWEEKMCAVLAEGRRAGRRHSTVILAEGAVDRHGNPIEAERIRKLLEERLGTETRTTVLGHVQRGGRPSAFDRTMGSLLGYAAIEEVLRYGPDDVPCLIGLRENRIARVPLMENVDKARAVGEAIRSGDFDRAMELRGTGFRNAFRILKTLVRAFPHGPRDGQRRRRFLVLHAGAPAPGMNTAIRAAVRLLVDQGHVVLGAHGGFDGLLSGDVKTLDWMSVHGWVSAGGAELGTSRKVPSDDDFPALAAALATHQVEGVLLVGGWAAYQAAFRMQGARAAHAPFRVPIVCIPAGIDNSLPGSELSIGADTALNAIVEAVDKIKQSAVAWRRAFVVEVMGRYCGYLAVMSGLATGAERVFTHEEGITMAGLERDLERLTLGFRKGKRLALMIRNENASPVFTTDFLRRLFEEEGAGLFDSRQAILGHLQQGGDPTPFDRIVAIRSAARAVEVLLEESVKEEPAACYLGFQAGRLTTFPLADLPAQVEDEFERAKEPWWRAVEPVVRLLGQAGPAAGA
ncbi:MAG: 6-phosphofructokinase [Thermoanaerobaculia bacterium]